MKTSPVYREIYDSQLGGGVHEEAEETKLEVMKK
jgi:hypothetical protein